MDYATTTGTTVKTGVFDAAKLLCEGSGDGLTSFVYE